MKRFIIILSVLSFALGLSAQSVLSFGVRGGLDFMIPKSNQSTRPKLGMGGNFDIGYTYYWPVSSSDLGIHTGISAGYATNETRILLYQQYTNYDYMANEMLYTISGDVNVLLKRAYAEIPLMLAFRSSGFIAQLGVKAQYSFWSKASQRVGETSIDAFYVPFNVHVTDELITGLVSDKDRNEKDIKGGAPKLNVLVAARIGYETQVGTSGRIGIAAYLDCNVWNNYASQLIDKPLIAVEPISNPVYPVPNVVVNNAFGTVISGMNPLQIGVSFYYGIEFERDHYGNNRRPKVNRSNMRYKPSKFRRKSNKYRPYYAQYGRH